MQDNHTGLEEWPRCCPACGGWANYIGTLGALAWYRCENCGADVSAADLENSEAYAGYVAGATAHRLPAVSFREWLEGKS